MYNFRLSCKNPIFAHQVLTRLTSSDKRVEFITGVDLGFYTNTPSKSDD